MAESTMKSWLGAMLGSKIRAGHSHMSPAIKVEDAAWWHVMGFASGPPRSLESVERRFRQLVARAHPDRGGSAARMQQLIRARAAARRQLSR